MPVWYWYWLENAEELLASSSQSHHDLSREVLLIEGSEGYCRLYRGEVVRIHEGVYLRQGAFPEYPSDERFSRRPRLCRVHANPPEEVSICSEEGFVLQRLRFIAASCSLDDCLFEGLELLVHISDSEPFDEARKDVQIWERRFHFRVNR